MTESDWFNFYGSFKDIFSGVREVHFITDNEAALMNADDPGVNDLNSASFKCNGTVVEVMKPNAWKLKGVVSKFMLLSAVQFKSDDTKARHYIRFELMGIENPYIRVGTDYFKVFKKSDRYGGVQTQIKAWKKETINDDHSKTFRADIPQFDDFIIEPDNKNYQSVIDNCYNHYSKFQHEPYHSAVDETDIPVTYSFLKHIFEAGTPDHSQLDPGLIYLKVLYEYPKKILPILTLISKSRETGKSTFINWIQMIFGANYVAISPEALTKQFNANYATKNIVVFEEAFIEKQAGIEKLKHLSTGKYIDVSQKWVNEYSLPFFGKFILCTNKVHDFMRIEKEENRFWLRPIPEIEGKKNVLIEDQLFAEIPKFLRYLSDMPAVNFDTGSRFVLTKEQTENDALRVVKEQSKTGLLKELEIRISDYFYSFPGKDHFLASPTDLKMVWFQHQNDYKINYIRQIIRDEMGLIQLEFCRYTPPDGESKTGTPFKFINPRPICNLPPPDGGIV